MKISKENLFFTITSILLFLFQLIIYIRICQIPHPLNFNMIILYLALVMPFILKKVKNKKLANILFSLYLIYLVIVFVGFLKQFPTANCDRTLVANLSQIASDGYITI